MTPDAAKAKPIDLPPWFPGWASQLAELYFSGTTAAFVLHGNTYDVFRIGPDQDRRYGVLAEFLSAALNQQAIRWCCTTIAAAACASSPAATRSG